MIDLPLGKMRKNLNGHKDYVYCVTYSKDGKLLASGARDGSVVVWNAATGDILLKSTKHVAEVTAMVFFADDRGLITTGWDGRTLFWDLKNRRVIHEQKESIRMHSLALSPDQSRLAIGDESGLITLWDITKSSALSAKQNRMMTSGHSESGAKASVTPIVFFAGAGLRHEYQD